MTIVRLVPIGADDHPAEIGKPKRQGRPAFGMGIKRLIAGRKAGLELRKPGAARVMGDPVRDQAGQGCGVKISPAIPKTAASPAKNESATERDSLPVSTRFRIGAGA
ncbi:MAG: hypothetical protein RQ750_02115 [Roseovarius sp.]|nr:hypothetical protein [Roseovarius sp.]